MSWRSGRSSTCAKLVYSAFERLAPAYLRRPIARATWSRRDLRRRSHGRVLRTHAEPTGRRSNRPAHATPSWPCSIRSWRWSCFPFLILVLPSRAWLRGRAERQGHATASGWGAQCRDRRLGPGPARDRGLRLREPGATTARRAQPAAAATRAEHGRRAGYERAATDSLIVLGFLAVLSLRACSSRRAARASSSIRRASCLPRSPSRRSHRLPTWRATSMLSRRPANGSSRHPRACPQCGPHVRGSLYGERPVVRFADVRFRYAADLPLALDGVSFDIQPHETVALVGHSGAGKTTCANLLLRFWDPEAGALLIDGHDLSAT